MIGCILQRRLLLIGALLLTAHVFAVSQASAGIVLYDNTQSQITRFGYAHAGEALTLSLPATSNPIRLDSFEFGLSFADSLDADVYDLSIVFLMYDGFNPAASPVGQDRLKGLRVQPQGAFSPVFGTVEIGAGTDRTAFINVDLLAAGQAFILPDHDVFIELAVQVDNADGSGTLNSGPFVNVNPNAVSLLMTEGGPSIGSTDDSIYVNRTGSSALLGSADLETIEGTPLNLYLKLNGTELAPTAVPEPASFALLCSALLPLAGYGWRRRFRTPGQGVPV